MRTATPFELPPMAVKYLRDSCKMFHGIWRDNKITGSLLEEVVARALDYDEQLSGHVLWVPHSHNAKADVRLETATLTLGISIKSGKDGTGRFRDMLIISGHRLSGAWGDMNQVNRMLKERVSDVVLCFVHSDARHLYECFYIDAPVFHYPTSATAWSAKVGNKNGRVTEMFYTTQEGMLCSIKHAMSSQIWWTIPRTLCRPGPVISYH